MGVIALVDGEHHPAAVREALDRLETERGLAGVVFCGGEEKLPAGALARPEELYGRAVSTDAPEAELRRLACGADTVVDLADEPALAAHERLQLASVAMSLGLVYEAPGMRLEPPERLSLAFAGRTVSVFGTAKRTGKTAVAGHLARLLTEQGRRPALVCMGRGGPAEPRAVGGEVGLGQLTAMAERGEHAASDYLEGAVLANVPSVGCRRVGGGWLTAAPGETNFPEAAAIAASLPVDTLVFDGSGSCVPPVDADRSVCVTGPDVGWLWDLALLRADLLLLRAGAHPADARGRLLTDDRVLSFELVSEPADPLAPDARVALFATGPVAPLDVDALVVSQNLARRAPLAADLDRAAAEGCDTYLTELKAAAIDTVAARARAEGARVVFLRNVPVGIDCDLDAELLALA